MPVATQHLRQRSVDEAYDARVGTTRVPSRKKTLVRQLERGTMLRIMIGLAVAATAVTLYGQQPPSTGHEPDQEGTFRFRSGVELINVTATVSDLTGRFVAGLRQDDFLIYEDDQLQTVTHFSAERVPVSLGIALDTSRSMSGEKLREATSAIDRLLEALAAPQDEFFLYRFSDRPMLIQEWTTDRSAISGALRIVTPTGQTAMYDAIADAIPLAQQGRNQKKALVVISDGNDTSSRHTLSDARQRIRESETLVYAIGVDCDRATFGGSSLPQRRGPGRLPIPFRFPPGGGRGRPSWPPTEPERRPGRRDFQHCSQPVDGMALRDLTDDSGGRTEIIRDPHDLNPATTRVADELSKQYYLGYPASGTKDGRWHAIRVEVRNHSYRVRARRGYMAS
jgi:Ca-activated chloride channel family protein